MFGANDQSATISTKCIKPKNIQVVFELEACFFCV